MNAEQAHHWSADSGLDAIELEADAPPPQQRSRGHENAPMREQDSAIDLPLEPLQPDMEPTVPEIPIMDDLEGINIKRNYCHVALFTALMLVPSLVLFMMLYGVFYLQMQFNVCMNIYLAIYFTTYQILLNWLYIQQMIEILNIPLVLIKRVLRRCAVTSSEVKVSQNFHYPGHFLVAIFMVSLSLIIGIIRVERFVTCCNRTEEDNQIINDTLKLNDSINLSTTENPNFYTLISTFFKANSCLSFFENFTSNLLKMPEANPSHADLLIVRIWLLIVLVCSLMRLGYSVWETCITWSVHWRSQPRLSKVRSWMSVRRYCKSACCLQFAFLLCALAYMAIFLCPCKYNCKPSRRDGQRGPQVRNRH